MSSEGAIPTMPKRLPSSRSHKDEAKKNEPSLNDPDQLAIALGKILLNGLDEKKIRDLSVEQESPIPLERRIPKRGSEKAKFVPSSLPIETHGSPQNPAVAPAPLTNEITDSRKSLFSKRGRRAFLKQPLPMGSALMAGAALALVFGLSFYLIGSWSSSQRSRSVLESPSRSGELSLQVQKSIDEILFDLNHDRPKEALVKIKKLKTFEPGLAQLSKIAADAALATRDLDSAQEFIDELFNSRQSLSDALVFQAWLETRRIADQNYTRFGDPKLRIEASLRQAMAADPTNPRPYVELAGLLRALKRPEEALQFLKSAQLRQSVDLDTIVVDVSLALLELQMMSDSELSQIPVKSGSDTQSLLAEVYRAMRLGDSSKAISRLEQARQSTPEKIFSKLLKDPAFVVYSRDPAYGDFFKK